MKFIITSILSFLLIPAMAQVGINTATPLPGVLHIDGQGNTTSATTQTSDDLLIDAQGRVAIGHASPDARLHIVTPTNELGAFIINDGTQASHRLLTTDANGNASWAMAGVIESHLGILGDGIESLISNLPSEFQGVETTDISRNTGASITLPPGTWLVTVTMLMDMKELGATTSEKYIWIRTSFGESNVDNARRTLDIVGSPYVSGTLYANCPATLNGSIVIRNSTNGNKTYHYLVNFPAINGIPSTAIFSVANKIYGENFILATKMSN